MDAINRVNEDGVKKFIILLFSIFLATMVFAQESAERHRTYIGLEYVKSSDQTLLQASLTARVKGVRGRKKIEDTEILFYLHQDANQHLLGSAITNADGLAVLVLNEAGSLELNADGTYEFEAVFKGNDEFSDVTEEISIQPVELKVMFEEIDSIKYIVVNAYQMTIEGEQIPVDEDVMVYVPRQFSRLTIGEIELDEGMGEVEFPVTLPGDSLGNLTIIARIEESRDFGTIEIESTKDWGAVREPVVLEKRRGLGDTDAPLWMVYTLIILMSAVWFHYLYILFVIYLIKRKGKISM